MKPGSNTAGPLYFLILFKVIYILAVTGMVLICPAGQNSAMGRVNRIQWTPAGHPVFESYFTTWDAGHYLHLVEKGYQSGHKSCAFYPLWPLLVRWISNCTGHHYVISVIVLANGFSLAGFFMFYRMVSRRFGESLARSSLFLLLAFPGSLFFQFGYSEGLFFLLVMLLSFGLERNRLKMALIAAFLLPLTRPLGIFCVFPIALQLIRRLPDACWVYWAKRIRRVKWLGRFPGREKGEGTGTGVAPLDQVGLLRWALLTAPFCGWGLYFVLMAVWTGNPFEGFAAQKYWGVQSVSNLFNVTKFVVGFLTPTSWHGFRGSMVDRCAFLLLLYCLPLIWRLDKGWFLWAVVLGIVPALTGTFTSFIRFESVVFPVFIALAVWLSSPGKKLLHLFVSASLVAMHLVFVWRFIYFEWAG